jgi:hypothetical protein
MALLPERARKNEIHWNNGSCANFDCTECALLLFVCARPIGVPENDPRWYEHTDIAAMAICAATAFRS